MMEGEDEESGDDRSFGKKSVWARISVVAAGPIFNFIMAFVGAFILLCNTGYDLPVLTGVTGLSRAGGGTSAGDTIIKMGKSRIHFFRDINTYMQFHPGEEVTVTYERDGERYQTRACRAEVQ